MLFAAIYRRLMRVVLDVLIIKSKTAAARDLELLALRHELAILRRQVRRPHLLPADRLILAALGRRLGSRQGLFSPTTILRWHRELVRRRWAAFGRRARHGRPPIADELGNLIIRLGAEGRATEGDHVGAGGVATGLGQLLEREGQVVDRGEAVAQEEHAGAGALEPAAAVLPPVDRESGEQHGQDQPRPRAPHRGKLSRSGRSGKHC